MARARLSPFAALVGALVVAGCASDRPPTELNGLWSAGPAACAAGVGVRFESGAIAAIYDRQRETLFDQPRYTVEDEGEHFRVRIEYALPQRPGGARSGGFGVLVLERGEAGALRPASHNLIDRRTGSARLRILGDPAMRTLSLRPCGPHPWQTGLRGRGAA